LRELIVNFFGEYANIIIFIHVISAVIWVGGMFVIKFVVFPVLKTIEDENIFLAKSISIIKSLFYFIIFSAVFVVLSSVLMLVGLGIKDTDLSYVAQIKEGIWMIMTGILIYAYRTINKTQKYFVSGNIESTKSNLKKLNIMLMINMFLGVVAIMLGITLRGF